MTLTRRNASWALLPVPFLCLLASSGLARLRRLAGRMIVALGLAAAMHGAQAEAVLRIGVIFPMTGVAKDGNKPAVPAMQLAADTINQGGGALKVDLRFYDNQSTAAGSLKAAKDAIADGVHAIVGPPWSSQAIPIVNFLESKKIPTFFFSATHPSITAGRQYMFRLCFNDESQGKVIAEFMRQQGYEQSITVYEQSDYSITLRDNFVRHFESLGGKNLTTLPTDMVDSLSDKDISTLKSASARSAVFLPLMAESARNAAIALRAQLPKTPIMIGDGFGQSFFLNDGNKLTRIFATQTASEESLEKSEESARLVEALHTAFPGVSDFNVVGHAALAYDAINVVWRAASQLGPDNLSGEKLRAALSAIEHRGVTGTVSFDAAGERRNTSAVILSINSGSITNLPVVSIGPKVLAAANTATSETRGAVRTTITAAMSDDVRRARKHALVIGINNYQHYPVLKTAENDARKISQVLKDKYGFTVRSLMGKDATKKQIMQALYQLTQELTSSDVLLIYYAGHGFHDRGKDKAYWLPADAEPPGNPFNWIMADEITTELKASEAKHALVISDSCYSGVLARDANTGFGTDKRERQSFLNNAWNRKSRTLLSSGNDEPVSDGGRNNHSVFAYYLIESLESISDDQFTVGELFQHINQPVTANSNQKPLLQRLQFADDRGGEFVFVQSNSPTKKP